MARKSKSHAKAERADHRLPPDDRLDREAAAGLLPIDELDRALDSRLTAADLKRAAAKATGAMGTSKKRDPSLAKPHAHASATNAGDTRDRGAAGAARELDKGTVKTGINDAVGMRVTKSNAEIAEGVTSTARKSPAPAACADTSAGIAGPRAVDKRTGATRQRAPAPGNGTTVPKREAVTGQKERK